MRADGRRVGRVHLLVVVPGAAVMASLQRRVEEAIAVAVGLPGGAAVDAALVPPLLERGRPATLATHVHDCFAFTNHASRL